MSEEKKVAQTEVINEDVMLERGLFTANGYTFTVKPVYLGEESLYLSEMTVSPVPNIEEDKTVKDLSNKELSSWAIALFSHTINENSEENSEQVPKKKNIFKKIFIRLFHRNNYHFYDDVPAVQPIIKWIEQKVTCEGKKIKFYDLERKYGLNKAEIEKLFIYFHELSGF